MSRKALPGNDLEIAPRRKSRRWIFRHAPAQRPGARLTAACALAWITASGAVGCAPFRALPLPARPAHSLAERKEVEGLVVATQALLDARTVDRYLGPRIWPAGYFAVIVHLENRGSGPVEIRRRSMRLVSKAPALDGRTDAPTGVASVLDEAARSTAGAIALAPLFIFPAIWASRSIDAYNADLAADLIDKAFPSYVRMEPGEPPLRGAVLFPRPASDDAPLAKLLENAELEVIVGIEGTRVRVGADGEAVATSDDASARGAAEGRVGRTATVVLPVEPLEE